MHRQGRLEFPAISSGKPVAGGKLPPSQGRDRVPASWSLKSQFWTCFGNKCSHLFRWRWLVPLTHFQVKYWMLIIVVLSLSHSLNKSSAGLWWSPLALLRACSLYNHLSLKQPPVVLVSGNALCRLPILTHRRLNQWGWEVKPNRNPTFQSSSNTRLQTEAAGVFTHLSFSISPRFSVVSFSKRSRIQKAMRNFPYCPVSRTLILCGLNTLMDSEGNSPLPPSPHPHS